MCENVTGSENKSVTVVSGANPKAESPVFHHWIDDLAEDITSYWGDDVKKINCSCGLSVSGLQHVGRLRGEVTLTNTIMNLLRDQGYQTRHTIIRYTSDEWKGKPPQISQFPDSEKAKSYVGRRLIDVPDPLDELPSWVDRYWLDFGNNLDAFSQDVEILSTHEIYSLPEMQKLVRFAIEQRESIRDLINRYRDRAPLSPDWIPVDVICERCHRISTTTVTAVDLVAYTAKYRCEPCKYEGTTSLVNGKLSWRVEWAALWKALNVGFEPFGKDHATPGGSRDSAKEVAELIFHFKPPFPFAYEWVGLVEDGVDKGDMGSSDFLGFTPKTWLSVASGEVLRYIFLKNKPMKRITLGLEYIPTYVGQFDRAERLYYRLESSNASPDEVADICRSYELAVLQPTPKKAPIQIPYLHAVILAQVIPEENLPADAVKKLVASKLIPAKLKKEDQTLIITRLNHAKTWALEYAPVVYRFKILDTPPTRLNQKVPPQLRTLYQQLIEQLDPKVWTEDAIRNAMKRVTRSLGQKKEVQREFFRLLYQVFFGRNAGPRIAAFLSFTNVQLVFERLRYLATPS